MFSLWQLQIWRQRRGSHAIFCVRQHASLALPTPDLYPFIGGVERMIANLKKKKRRRKEITGRVSLWFKPLRQLHYFSKSNSCNLSKTWGWHNTFTSKIKVPKTFLLISHVGWLFCCFIFCTSCHLLILEWLIFPTSKSCWKLKSFTRGCSCIVYYQLPGKRIRHRFPCSKRQFWSFCNVSPNHETYVCVKNPTVLLLPSGCWRQK